MFKEIPTLPFQTDLATLRDIAQAEYHIRDNPQFRLLLVTCGLPRSGKSTWARQLNLPMVDPDAVRLAFQGRPYLKETEEWIWSITRVMVKSLFYAGHRDIIVQGCNTAMKHRAQWADRGELWYRLICVFDTPVKTCITRARENVRPELIHIIDKMDNEWEKPQPFEGAIVRIAT